MSENYDCLISEEIGFVTNDSDTLHVVLMNVHFVMNGMIAGLSLSVIFLWHPHPEQNR